MERGVWSELNTHLYLVFGALAQVIHKFSFTQGRYEERVVPYAYLQPVERGGGRRQWATGAANGSYGVDVVALGLNNHAVTRTFNRTTAMTPTTRAPS